MHAAAQAQDVLAGRAREAVDDVEALLLEQLPDAVGEAGLAEDPLGRHPVRHDARQGLDAMREDVDLVAPGEEGAGEQGAGALGAPGGREVPDEQGDPHRRSPRAAASTSSTSIRFMQS
jgi:hypothetical protein